MKLKRIDELEGNEILAKPVMTWDYQIVLPEGAKLKKEYLDKILELGIISVYIKEEAKENEILILKSSIEQNIMERIKDILGTHTYHNNKKLSELSEMADSIISTILEEEQVVEKVYDIRERSADIYEHSINVCSFAILTALKLNVHKSKIHDIGVGCLLHDIGLRYTTVDVNDKDVEKVLSKQELAEYKKHPVYGYSSLQEETWLSQLSKNIIIYHHERMDGSGFPLKVREIPFECRIVNVCDAFDEMICGISCKRVKVHEAVEYLKNYKDILFEGRIVDAFLAFMAVYPVGTHVVTNEGETAVVIAQNKFFRERPVIRIIKDKDGNSVEEETIKDLMKIQSIFIEKVID